MIGEHSRRVHIALCVTVITASLISFAQKNIAFHTTSAFERIMIDTLAPLQRSVSFLHHQIRDIFVHYTLNIHVSKENVELKKEINELKKKIYELSEIERENKRLKELLAFGQQSSYRKVLAKIVAWDATSDFKVIRINKGLKSGIALQSTVVTAKGLVGHVFRLTNNFADILTILDSNNRVDGIIQRTRAYGIVQGDSKQKCIMKYVNRTEPVLLNDLVITAGVGNIYPKGIVIGNITRIERENYGTTQKIEITPSVTFPHLEEVVVLIDNNEVLKKREQEALKGSIK